MRHGRYFGLKRPVRRIGGTPTPPPAWTPADLGSQLIGWWDFSDAATVTHSGSTITSVADKSGNGFTMLPSGSIVYTAAGGPGGLGIVEASGGYLEASIPAGLFDSPGFITLASVWKKVGLPTTYNSGPMNRGLANFAAPIDSFDDNRYISDGTGPGTPITGATNLGTSGLITAWNSLIQSIDFTTDIRFREWISGVLATTNVATRNYDDASGVLTIASRADHATSANSQHGENVATTLLNDTNRGLLAAYFAAKWGL